MSSVRQLLPDDPSKRNILAAFLALWAVSCIRVPYPEYFWLQHVPTVAVIVALVVADSRFHIGRLCYALILALMTLHLLGARYLYSYVPYDYWLERLFGVGVTKRFGLTRNHYDRFVHMSFGLLLVIPAWRFSRRVVGLDGAWGAVFAFMAILTASAAHEIFEWLAAVVMAPDWADSYNGQQGDLCDAQKDMAWAACGALMALAFTAPWWLAGSRHATVDPRSP